MERERRLGRGTTGPGAATATALAPGKRALTDLVAPAAPGRPLQLMISGAPTVEPADRHRVAAQGITGSAGTLPHLDAIQRAFGRHDVSGIAAHVGGPAAAATAQLGAKAYASGDAVAFDAAPDLHTTAHEAAHVIQQRAGVHFKGGVGEQGDAYERGADEVADAVVAGRSAEPLLDRMAPGGAPGAAPPGALQHLLVKRRGGQAMTDHQVKTDHRWSTLDANQKAVLLDLAHDPQDTLTLDEAIDRVRHVPQIPQPRGRGGDRGAQRGGRRAPHAEPAPRLTALEPGADTYDAPIVDLQGNRIGTAPLHHPLFRKLTGEGFIYVQLAEGTDAATLARGVTFEGTPYRTDLMAGSLIKPDFEKPGRVFGIPVASAEKFKRLFGFEESAYYAQRALFPQVVGGVAGQIRTRAYPIGAKADNPDEQHDNVFKLKNGTPIQVDDGWGYVNSKLAGLMANRLTRDKRGPKTQGANTNYQMYQWFQDSDRRVTEELANEGYRAWQRSVDDLAAKAGKSRALDAHAQAAPEERAAAHEEVVASRKGLYSVLTTGRPSLQMGVAMPVPGERLVLPSGDAGARFDPEGQGAAVIRSPIDKQNWRPVPRDKVAADSRLSRLVGNIEGIQYTLTGSEDGVLTFFKGMVGVIDNSQWPDAWAGLDLVVCAKDRKLYEDWTRDSSVDHGPRVEGDRTDRAVDQSASGARDFTIDGNFAATQWYAKGSFVGVPAKLQKWLGGDFDGDEVAVLRQVNNPALFGQIQREYKEKQLNPKLDKGFTYAPDGSRAARMVDMQSSNVAAWSGIAARVSSLPPGSQAWLANRTHGSRLVTDPDEPQPADPIEAMLKEIQSGIKVGTDGYKAKVDAPAWEARARVYADLLRDEMLFEIFHNKIVIELLKACPTPTLHDAGWRNAYFANDTEVAPGEFLIRGVSARVTRSMLAKILPVAERAQTSAFYFQWLAETGNGDLRRFGRWQRLLDEIDQVNGFFVGSAERWVTEAMATLPDTAGKLQAAFSERAQKVPMWNHLLARPDWRLDRTMRQLAILFTDYYAPPPAVA